MILANLGSGIILGSLLLVSILVLMFGINISYVVRTQPH